MATTVALCSSRSPRRRAVAAAVVAAAALAPFAPALARAHTLGLSLADFEVESDGGVDARLTFASVEPLGGLRVDRDHDGFVTDGDLRAAAADLRSFFLQGVEVDADGSPCSADFRGASLSEGDGLVLDGHFACPRGAAEITATLYYLSALRRGHRELAQISAGDAVNTAVLTGERRAITLRLPASAQPHPSLARRIWPGAAGAAVACLVGCAAWGSRRWRGARRAWQNRTP